MSEENRTVEEYIEKFARDHCEGDKEKAKGFAIVKEVVKNLKE